MTIREQTIEYLIKAEKLGIISSKERRDTVHLMQERDSYADNTRLKMREGFLEREQKAWEVINKAMNS